MSPRPLLPPRQPPTNSSGAFAAPFLPSSNLTLTHPTESSAPLKLYLLLLSRRLPLLPPPFPSDITPVLLLLGLLERWEPGFPSNAARRLAQGIPDLPHLGGEHETLLTINTYPLLLICVIGSMEKVLKFSGGTTWPREHMRWYQRLWADPAQLARHLPMIAGIIGEREKQGRRWAREVRGLAGREAGVEEVMKGAARVVLGIGWGLSFTGEDEVEERE